MIIGFTPKTSKKIPKLICRHFRHCVVLFPTDADGRYTLVQIARDGIRLLPVGAKEIETLGAHGWVWINVTDLSSESRPCCGGRLGLLTCVGFAKRALGIRNPWLWTPDQLYRYLNQNKKLL